ncbi:magnesium chelatase domain-containing protein [Caulobacter segnis]
MVANLGSADMPKEGTHFDLPIALAVMAALGVIPLDALDGWAAMGAVVAGRAHRPGRRGAAGDGGGRRPGPRPDLSRSLRSEAAWAGGTRILASALVGLADQPFPGRPDPAVDPDARPRSSRAKRPRTCATSRARGARQTRPGDRRRRRRTTWLFVGPPRLG